MFRTRDSKEFLLAPAERNVEPVSFHRPILRSAGARIYLSLRSMNIWLRWSQEDSFAAKSLCDSVVGLFRRTHVRLESGLVRQRDEGAQVPALNGRLFGRSF
jgi:hypothetical protein